MKQSPGVWGRGVATRLVNAVKSVTFAAVAKHRYIVAAAENAEKADKFWRKQKLAPGPAAEHIIQHLHEAGAVLRYENTTHVFQKLTDADAVAPQISQRAIEAQSQDEALTNDLKALRIEEPSSRLPTPP